MSSESRLQRRRLGGRDNSVSDDPQTSSDDGILYNTIKVGLIALAGRSLWRAGVLKPIATPLLELGDKISKEGSERASVVMSTIKEWTLLKHMDPAVFANSNSLYNVPEQSIFRTRNTSIFYDLYQDIRENVETSGYSNFSRVREIIQRSSEDLGYLQDMVDENLRLLPNKRNNFYNTDLYRQMQEVKAFERTIDEYSSEQSIAFNKKAMEEFMKTRTLTIEKASEQLRTSGYRQLTLGDVMEIVTDSNGNHHFAMRADAPINLDTITNAKYKRTLMDSIEQFFMNSYHWVDDGSGRRVSPVSSGLWKNITLDSDIRINENGDFIDYRMSRETLNNFIDSLSNDFGLPVVKFNPMRTLFGVTGLDQKFSKHPFLGAIANTQFDPSLTGRGGQYTIGQWLSDKFGDEYAKKNVAIINGAAYTTNTSNQLVELGSGFNLYDISKNVKASNVNPRIDATRQIAGLHFGEPYQGSVDDYAKYVKDNFGRDLTDWERRKYQAAQWLDLGNKEWRPKGSTPPEGFDSTTSIDHFVDEFINRRTMNFRLNGYEYADIDEMLTRAHELHGSLNYSSIFGEGFGDVFDATTGKTYRTHKYMTTRQGYKLGNVVDKLSNNDIEGADEELKGFFLQFLSGRLPDNTMGKYFTERTTHSWATFNSLNDQLSNSVYFLGFSNESKRNVVEYGEHFLLQRALPIYLATKIPDVINYFSEPFFYNGNKDGTDNKDNITKFITRNAIKPLDIQAHYAMDMVGATDLFKFMQEFTPGYDQINELPGIYHLGLGQTAEERKEYIEKGMDPVRKGRWWGAGNTPLTGGKIEYWRPNIYRRVEADVQFSDSKWGSRQEYYENTWFPNPINPFAPLNHFIFNRNHYDYKHYYDRPYLATAPEGQNIPLIGPLFGSTIGQIINPSQRMHTEYWRDLRINPADEQPGPLLTEGKRYISPGPYQHFGPTDYHVFNQVNAEEAAKQKEKEEERNRAKYTNSLYTSSYQAKQVTKRRVTDSSGILFSQRTVYPSAPAWSGNAPSPFSVYSTPSGQMTIVDIPDHRNLYDVNQDLRNNSINKVIGTNTRVTIGDMNYPDIPVGNDDQEIDNAFMFDLGEQYNWVADVMGLKGFAIQQFITGYPNTEGNVIENSGYAYSFNNDFWNQNLGGLGGNLSEITRRFIPKRNNQVNYVNPIRNTMPSWMPGSDYFTDFKHGDPYVKVANGEERLPGEGYERLYDIRNPLDLRIGSSSIGYDKSYIIKHMLNQDWVESDFEEKTLNTGNKIHKHIESMWKEAGIAFATEGEVKDNRNGILGYYDAMVYDMSSPTGIGIVDIKSTSAKKLKEIRRTGQPLEHHRRQVNYYLWATDNMDSKGYIYYIDKENPNNTYTVGFNYDDARLRDTLKNVNEARNEIRSAIRHGEIGRGELYSTLDQYRILADVAPYSQEFKDAKAKLSREQLSDEDHKEYQQINKRLQAQKQSLRVYPYKFKTSNLIEERVKVKKILDNNTFIVSTGHGDETVRFAGITVTESSDPVYKKKYPRKRRKGLEKVAHNIRKKIEAPPTKAQAANRKIRQYMSPGTKITIAYDADERNKHSSDSLRTIRAVVYRGRTNVNRALIGSGWAKEKENDDSPAGINVRYNRGEIAFGSAMETLTHSVIGNIPFIGSKLYQVKSPYEQYRDREVYGKDFQSWNHPIRDIFIPNMVDKPIGNQALGGVLPIITGAFMGSLFGRTRFGQLVGGTIGAAIPAIGKIVYGLNTNQDREWRPKRRIQQEQINEYVDILKYVKNMRLYNQYAEKAKVEDNFDVESFIGSKEAHGTYNKFRLRELQDFKRQVKLDFKNSKRYNFKYGEPRSLKRGMSREQVVKAVNQEIQSIQGDRRVQNIPLNAMKAIEFKNQAEKTMYAYDPGDSLVDIMSSLPKKERQYFKYFMDAPEEEKPKILRIAPSYLRRALQSTWGMQVDSKPTLQEYFQNHALPDDNWIGWDENVSMDDIKVKIVHQQKMDPGEFDIWADTKRHADQVNVPIPKLKYHSSPRETQIRLQQILGDAGYANVQANMIGGSYQDRATVDIQHDARDTVANQIRTMEV